jgi:hypothetical protein
MFAVGGRGTLLREVSCGAEGDLELIDLEFMDPSFMPRLPKLPLPLWGRGEERESMAPFCGPRTLFRTSEPRLPADDIGRCSPPGLTMLLARAPELNAPRLPADEADRLTTGRANARCGGTAALPPLEPSMLARVGATPGEWTALILLKAFGETRRLLRETDSEFTSVLRETAVKPPGECMFA